MSEFLPKMSAIAQEAGKLLMGYFAKGISYEYKGGEIDLVTDADRASERLIVGRLHEQWPEHEILAEEGTHRVGNSYHWHVDPLDGTTNFAHGYPVFCVSIGLEHEGELQAGVLFDPTRNELFAAECGRGATLNGQPIRVSRTPKLAESILGTGFPSYKRHKDPNIHFYHQLTLRSHGVRRAGSAALDMANVACGRYDGFWEFNLNPWDTCAGVSAGAGSRGDDHALRRLSLAARQQGDAGLQWPAARRTDPGVRRDLRRKGPVPIALAGGVRPAAPALIGGRTSWQFSMRKPASRRPQQMPFSRLSG